MEKLFIMATLAFVCFYGNAQTTLPKEYKKGIIIQEDDFTDKVLYYTKIRNPYIVSTPENTILMWELSCVDRNDPIRLEGITFLVDGEHYKIPIDEDEVYNDVENLSSTTYRYYHTTAIKIIANPHIDLLTKIAESKTEPKVRYHVKTNSGSRNIDGVYVKKMQANIRKVLGVYSYLLSKQLK